MAVGNRRHAKNFRARDLGFSAGAVKLPPQMLSIRDERVKQVAIGVGIIVPIMVIVPSLLVGWRHMPGLIGETVGVVLGILTTPFFMEASFVILGFLIVVGLNNWRRHKDGDEFVELEPLTKNENHPPEK
jgi:uncharacterized membrane protein